MRSRDLRQKINDAVAVLSEHCEGVQVLATWTIDRKTYRHYTGLGNWYSRQGMAQEFINIDRAQEIAGELSCVLMEDE